MPKKRANGEGTILKRGAEGRFEVKVSLGGKRYSVYGKTRAEALAKRDELKRQHERGMEFSTKNLTVGEFLQQYYDEVASVYLKPRVSHRYKELMDKYIIPKLGERRLRELNPRHVQAFINGLPKHLAANTVRHVRSVLRRALNIALSWNLVEYNAASPVQLPKADGNKVVVLEPSQIAALFRVLAGHPREALYRCAIMMGPRQGELLALRKTDVNVVKRELNIDSQFQKIDGKVQRVSTKTGASKRTLVIPDLLWPYIERTLQEQTDCLLLFPSEEGTPILARNLVRQFKELLVKASIMVRKLPNGTLTSDFRFHDLRHTAGSLALANGMDVTTTQEMLGHAQASTTLNIYGHVLRENRSVVVNNVVNKAFGDHNGEEPPD